MRSRNVKPQKLRSRSVENPHIPQRRKSGNNLLVPSHSNFYHCVDNSQKMEFPPNQNVEPLDDFDEAVATLATSGNAVAIQLLAQLQPT